MRPLLLFILFVFAYFFVGKDAAQASVMPHHHSATKTIAVESAFTEHEALVSTYTPVEIEPLILTIEEDDEEFVTKKQISLTNETYNGSEVYLSLHHYGCPIAYRHFHNHLSYTNTSRFIAQRSLRI